MSFPCLAAARVLATVGIAAIAAWVSYWHMAGVAARYGETGPSPYLLPLSVDGLIVIASVSLVELAARLRDHEHAPVPLGDPSPVGPSIVDSPQATVTPTDPVVPAAPPARSATMDRPAREASAPPVLPLTAEALARVNPTPPNGAGGR